MGTTIFQKELETEIEKQEIDFFYFVDISQLSKEQNKGYSAALLFGVPLSRAYLEEVAMNPDYVEGMKRNKAIEADEFHLTEQRTDRIADDIEKFIVSKRFKAYSQSEDHVLKTGYYDQENKKTPLPHKTIAGLAGLGWIGKHNLLVTKNYGSAISMCSVLTDAPVETMRQEPLLPNCGDCTVCKEICKSNAIKGEIWECGMEREKIIDVFSCTTCFQCVVQCPWTQKYIKGKR
jgi:epoxyqueuosine reductase QueG